MRKLMFAAALAAGVATVPAAAQVTVGDTVTAGQVGMDLGTRFGQRVLRLPESAISAVASDDSLLRRFSETRRRHPLAPEGSVAEGIGAEAMRHCAQGLQSFAIILAVRRSGGGGSGRARGRWG